jgi:hypothetical protein
VPRLPRLDLLCIGLDPLPLEADFLGTPLPRRQAGGAARVQVPAPAADMSRVGRQDFCAAMERHL